jgi:hypothetical protein
MINDKSGRGRTEGNLLRSLTTVYVESGTTSAKGPLHNGRTRLYTRCRPGNSQSGRVRINLDSILASM